MENEKDTTQNKYMESGVYQRLLEIEPEMFDAHLDNLVGYARKQLDEEAVLEIANSLILFVSNKELPSVNRNVLTSTIEELFPILDHTRLEDNAPHLVEDYAFLMLNLEEIKSKVEDDDLIGKCCLGQAILTFPKSEVFDGDFGLDS